MSAVQQQASFILADSSVQQDVNALTGIVANQSKKLDELASLVKGLCVTVEGLTAYHARKDEGDGEGQEEDEERERVYRASQQRKLAAERSNPRGECGF